MSLNLSMPTVPNELKPRITVIGVGGAGGNAVNNMIRSNLEGVEFIVANTDAQAIAQSICPRKVQLGVNITQGLGAGARPDVGRAAAEEALDEIMENLHGANMVFITAGMGGGTGTGGAPVIARAAREQGILTVGVVTKPFHFEGAHRMRLAESGIEELQQFVDTLLIIPNQNLFRIANEKTTFADAFAMADQVLHSGVRGVTDLMVMPGLINLDFADIRTVMSEMGKAMMGTGEASGENRAVAAAEAAISNPLLDDVSMKGARGVLINITGGFDMTLFEVDEAANRIREEVDPDANIIFGSTFDQSLEGRMRISVVATGIDAALAKARSPQQHASISLVGRGGRVSTAAAEPHASEAPQRAPVRQEMRRQPEPRHVETRQPEVRVPMPPAPVRQAEPAAAPAARAPEPPTVSRAPWPEEQRPAPQPPVQTYEPEPEPESVADAMDEVEPDFVETRPAAFRASEPAPVQPVARAPEPAPRAERFTEPPVRAERYAEPPARSERFTEPPARAERFVEPAPSRAPEGKRRSGLFARVTGSAAWSRQNGEPRDAAPAPTARSTPAEPPARMEPPARLEAVRSEPPARAASPAPQPRQAPQQPAAQPRLAGLDPRERLQPSRAEEDVLDIPAFLRRQAN